MDETRAQWLITGRVQGVGFRWFVLQAARRHAIRGDVRNLRDGRVEVRAVGSDERMAAFSLDLLQGPPGARVDGVERLPLDDDLHFENFDVRH